MSGGVVEFKIPVNGSNEVKYMGIEERRRERSSKCKPFWGRSQ